MKAKTISFWKRLKEISRFFEGRDEVHKTLKRLVRRLKRARICYTVVGGMAVNAHKHRKTTEDVDVLMTTDGLDQFRQQMVPKRYGLVEGRSRRFRDRENDVPVNVLVTGRFPGNRCPGPIALPDPGAVGQDCGTTCVANLLTLIELKLAAGRYQDLGDVVGLIRFNELDESFAERLHPSVRGDYIECLEEKRREDEYEARED